MEEKCKAKELNFGFGKQVNRLYWFKDLHLYHFCSNRERVWKIHDKCFEKLRDQVVKDKIVCFLPIYINNKVVKINSHQRFCAYLNCFRSMYWTSHGSRISINRASMDGYAREKIVSGNLIDPTDLALDKQNKILYWLDGGNIINYISLNSRKRKVCYVYFIDTTSQLIFNICCLNRAVNEHQVFPS